jgi:hypothetical protein
MSMLAQEVTLDNSDAYLGFSQSLQGEDGIVSYLGHESYLRHSIQIITHQLSYILKLYIDTDNFIK